MFGRSARACSAAHPPIASGDPPRAAWEQVWHREEDHRQASARGLAQVECRLAYISETTTGSLHFIKGERLSALRLLYLRSPIPGASIRHTPDTARFPRATARAA